jgi:acetyl-CoA carboxylase carboxyltransferase component
MDASAPHYLLENPLAPAPEAPAARAPAGAYDQALQLGRELLARPRRGGGFERVRVQHAKNRMTVWERIAVLTQRKPNILFQNWGPGLDGASIVTGILDIGGRDVAIYGHDFTLRAGSMDATNGAKLARLIYMAAERGIPLIGMNDSAGADSTATPRPSAPCAGSAAWCRASASCSATTRGAAPTCPARAPS